MLGMLVNILNKYLLRVSKDFSFSLRWVEAKRFSPQESEILRKITRNLGIAGTGNEVPGKRQIAIS